MKACTFIPIVLAAVAAAFPALEARGATSAIRVRHEDALRFLQLEGEGVTVASTGGCSDKNDANCTSLDDIWVYTLEGVIALSKECKTPIVITGGTEVGHAPGAISHASGNKVNLRRSKDLDACIRAFKPIAFEDEKEAFRRDAGSFFINLGNSWDATFELV